MVDDVVYIYLCESGVLYVKRNANMVREFGAGARSIKSTIFFDRCLELDAKASGVEFRVVQTHSQTGKAVYGLSVKYQGAYQIGVEYQIPPEEQENGESEQD